MLDRIKNLIIGKNPPNFIIYGSGQAINILSPLLISPYIVHVCSESGLGKTAIGLSLAFFLILIVDYSFEIKGTKEVSDNREDAHRLNSIFNLVFKSKIVLLIVALLIGFLVINVVPVFNSESDMMYFSLVIVIAQVFNPTWFLQGNEDFKAISAINIMAKITYITLIFILVKKQNDYIFVNLILGTTSLIFNIFGLIYLKRKYMITNLRTRGSDIHMILRRDFTFCLSQLFLSVRQLSPILLVTFYMGHGTAGQYRILEQIIMLFRTLIQVLLRFFYPGLCYKVLRDKVSGVLYWKKYSATLLGFVIIAVIMLIIFAAPVLRFFNLDETTTGLLTNILRIGLIIPVLMVASLSLEQLMFVFNKNRAYIRITFAVTTINVFLMLVLIPAMNLKGVMISLIVADLIFIAAYYYIVRNYLVAQHSIASNKEHDTE